MLDNKVFLKHRSSSQTKKPEKFDRPHEYDQHEERAQRFEDPPANLQTALTEQALAAAGAIARRERFALNLAAWTLRELDAERILRHR